MNSPPPVGEIQDATNTRRPMTERPPVTFGDYHEPRQRWYALTAAPDPEGELS